MLLDFGQPPGGIIQYAYTVPDAYEAARRWTEIFAVGPWLVRGPFTASSALYRGQPTEVELTLARTFNGHTMIELVQQHNDVPSVYREIVEARGYGFHHWGVASTDIDKDIARYGSMGFDVAFEDVLPSRARVAYIDTTRELPGMTELISMDPAQEAFYTRIYRTALDWDGTDFYRREL
ncbi:VOC family protein [Okibacterium endophyticum]